MRQAPSGSADEGRYSGLTPRLALGFVAIPFVAALAGFVLWPLTQIWSKQDWSNQKAAAVAVFFFITAAVVLVLEAGPLFFWWRRHRRVTFAWTIVWGGILGNTPTVVATILLAARGILEGGSSASFHWAWVMASLGTSVGVASAAAFWFISLRDGRSRLLRVERGGDS